MQSGKLISKVEVPAFIPRQDLCEQLYRWALSNAQDEGLANFGWVSRPGGSTAASCRLYLSTLRAIKHAICTVGMCYMRGCARACCCT